MTRAPTRSSRALPAHRLALAAAVLLACGHTQAADEQGSTAEPFMLGVVTVIGKREKAQDIGAVGNERVASVIDRKDILQFNRDTIGDALNLLPGVTLSTNSRNEKTIAVRGFDSRQVPLFIDGIPFYVPYDGYVDFNRFTTADLAAIQVDKGFGSVAYGPNTLGGAINLISRKPVQRFEADVSTGVGSEQQRKAALNIGTNQGLWYLQAGASRVQSEGFPLSSDFTATATEDGDDRENADRKDTKLSFKVGLTPNQTDEYAISYYRQDGEKGQPPSTDPAVARYWRWPYWDKQSLYFLSNTALGSTEFLKIRLYRDEFDNEVDSYTDGSYRTLKTSGRGSVGTGRSIYDDRTDGGSVALESYRLDAHALRLVAHCKTDSHAERDATGRENTTFEDTLRSYALEDSIDLAPAWMLSLGVARHELRPDKVFSIGNPYSLPDTQKATDAQAGLFHDWSPTARLYVTVASKTRLPTLKDRYSQRLGTYVENPELSPEESINYEIGYRGTPWPGVTAEAALFYSDISDKIQSVANVVGTRSQMQNVGKVRSAGFEVALRCDVGDALELGGSYTHIDLDNRSDPATRLTDVPGRKAVAHALWRVTGRLDVIALAEHNSSRWASNTVRLDGFSTVNLKLAFRPLVSTTIETGVENLSDSNYALADGFPAAGRTWFLTANYHF
ncbi:MAG: Vitamin B12 transporter BtuB [Pseudomonadales bacterium]|nr:Vitamin B12 transporter BtuB [Pseudomonadales bacterium]